MKRLVLVIISAFICGAVFIGCSNNEAPKDEKTTGDLYVIGIESATVSAGDKTDLVFIGEDIISYNVSTGEIVFAESKLNGIISRLGLYSKLEFFIDDKSVFVPPIWIHSPLSSAEADDLHLRFCDSNLGFNKIYLVKQKEQEETHKNRKKELDVLINFLSDARKMVEHEAV